MSESDSGRDLLDELAHDFAERFRRGERPSLTEYTAKHPELAAEIRDLFPAMVVIEQFGSVGGGPAGSHTQTATCDGHAPRQLGEYRIFREVARGGMGIVYEAVQESLGRHVALKVLPFQSLADANHLERFRREAQAAAKLPHTNIVPVFSVGEHEGVHYFAMQFIKGQPLNSVLHELKCRRQPEAPDAGEPAEASSSVLAGKRKLTSQTPYLSRTNVRGQSFSVRQTNDLVPFPEAGTPGTTPASGRTPRSRVMPASEPVACCYSCIFLTFPARCPRSEGYAEILWIGRGNVPGAILLPTQQSDLGDGPFMTGLTQVAAHQAGTPFPFWRKPVVHRTVAILLPVFALGAVCWWFWGGSRGDGKRTLERDRRANRSEADSPRPALAWERSGTVHLDKAQQQAIGLRTAEVSSGTSRHVVTAPGRIAPNETQFAYITPRASGVVRSVTARLGQEVKAGDLLATIDSPIVGDARLELYSRLQTLELAKAQADWQEAIYRNTLDLLERLKKRETPLQIHEAFTDKAVGENREKLMTAYAQYRLAVATMDRSRELFAQKLITPKQFQQVNADFEVAQATYQSLMDQMGFDARLANTRAQQARKQAETRVRAAQERLRILGVKPDGTEPEVHDGKVLGVKPDGTLPASAGGAALVTEKPETVLPPEKERGKVAVEPVGAPGDAAMNLADAPVSSYSIWAPFDGTVLDREMIVPGVAVDTNHRMFTLADLSSVYIEANIHENVFDVLARTQGGKVRFSSPAYPGRVFEGEVIYTGDLVEDTSRTVKLLARAQNPNRLLKPGMFVNVEILGPQITMGLQVPASALLMQADHSLVYVRVGPDEFVQREIDIDVREGDMVSVHEGLKPGEEIVVEGAFKLKALAGKLAKADR